MARRISRLDEGEVMTIGAMRGPMAPILARLARVARSPATVLLLGETGTGKDLLARALHNRSDRATAPLVSVNCAAVPDTLWESELFGYRRGAFTGADADRHGRFEEARGGTIFLDEVGEVPLAVQGKLLRAIQEEEVRPLGATRDIAIDVRVVAATNRDLSAMVSAGTFREDLYYRLRVVKIAVPPLRARPGDLIELFHACARHHAERYGVPELLRLAPDALAVLLAHDWPGNVRELDNVVQSLYADGHGGLITALQLPADLQPRSAASADALAAVGGSGRDLAALTEAFERYVLEREIQLQRGSVAAAGRALGVARSTMQYRVQRLVKGR